jgi:hypothetical protein
MAPLRGWGPGGKRLRGFAPHGHWRTLTFVGALRLNGLIAPCVFDGPINGKGFRAYVEQQLLPVLKAVHRSVESDGFPFGLVCDSRCWLGWRPASNDPTSFQ